MSNDFYNVTGAPSQGSKLTSPAIRAEFAAIAAGMDKLPSLSGHDLEIIQVKVGGTGLQSLTFSAALLAASLAGPINFGGAVTGITDLTTTGNTILGNAVGDTLNVASGSLQVSAAGNVGIGAAPTTKLDIGTTSDASNTVTVRAQAVGLASMRLNVNTFGVLSLVANNSGSPDASGVPTGALGVATGQAVPIVFATSGMERMRLPAGGGLIVGGTTSPLAAAGRGLISIIGTSTAFIDLDVGGTSYGYFGAGVTNAEVGATGYLDFATNGAERMRIDTSGNVGIGGTPSSKLTVWTGGGAEALRLIGTDSFLSFYNTANSTRDGYIAAGAGGLDIAAEAGGVLRFLTSGAERLRIDSSGRVGIGKTPVYGLDVSGSVNAPNYLIGSEATSSAGTFGFTNSNGPAIQAWGSATANPGALVFNTAGSEKARFDSSGNFILGSTGATGKLDIVGGGSNTYAVVRVSAGAIAGVRLAGNGNGVGSGSFDLQQDGSSNVDIVQRSAARMSFYTSALERMRIDASGNVGVGMTPLGDTAGYGGPAFEVGGAVYARQSTDNTKYLSLGTSGGASYIEANGTGQTLIFYVASAERLRITNAGALTAADASGLANLNASNLASGTVAAGRISGAVAYDISAATVNTKAVGYRGLPAASVTTGAFGAADAGKCVYATGGVTVPNSTMAAEDVVVIQNVSGVAQTITASVGTLRWTATGGTGNRTLAAYGRCAIVFQSGTSAFISGDLT